MGDEIETEEQLLTELDTFKTKCRLAEEELQSLELCYRSLFESAPVGIGLSTFDGQILSYNAAMCQMTGYSGEELKQINLKDTYRNLEDRTLLLECQKKEGSVRNFEVELKRKDGAPYWASLNITPLALDGKNVFLTVAEDITERKRVKDELKIERERVEKYLHIAGVLLSVVDSDGNITLINKKGCEILGYNEKELIGRNWFDTLVPERMRGEVRAVFNKLMAGEIKSVEYYENPLLTKDGEERLFLFHNTVIKTSDGQIVGSLTSGEDITERKKIEEKYRDLVEKEKDIIYTLDDKGNITFASSAVKATLGYRPEELLGKNFVVLIPREMQKKTVADFNNLLKTGETTAETVLLDRKGQPHFVEYNSTVVKEGNKVVGTRGIVRDITERKQAEEASKRAEEALRQKTKQQEVLLSSIPAFVYFKDAESKLITANRAFAEMVNTPVDQLPGKDAYDLFPKEQAEKFHVDDKKVMESGKPMMNIEEKFTDAEGKTRWASTSKVPYFDEKGEVVGMVGITMDITERKKAEMALVESESKLKKQKSALEQKNIALQEMIQQIAIEREKVQDDIVSNVNMVLFPILEKLKTRKATLKYVVNLLQHHLKGLTSSYGSKIIKRGFKLTTREIEICNMVKAGSTSKDIANLLNISTQTVEKHRKNIRHKLGISNTSVNLTSFLREL